MKRRINKLKAMWYLLFSKRYYVAVEPRYFNKDNGVFRAVSVCQHVQQCIEHDLWEMMRSDVEGERLDENFAKIMDRLESEN